MINKFLIGAVTLSLFAGMAYAANEQVSPPPPEQGQMAGGQDGGQQGWWGRHRPGRHHDMRGEMGGPGGPGMMGMMNKQGFSLQLGPNINVGIICGTQALKDCIAEAQPLIDAAKAAASIPPK